MSSQLSSGMPGVSAHIQCQTPYRKGFNKNQVLLKSSNSGWDTRGANDNLVISFSDDDDSGSDVEERRRGKASSCDRPPLVLNSNRKPPALPHVTMKTVSRTAKNEGKLMPQKVSSSRPYTSSMAKIPESNARSGVSALAEQKSYLKNSTVTGRGLSSQDPGCSKNLDMSSSKLEDLRQQIAERENELKLKLVQQNKENVSEPCKEANTMGHKKVPSRKCKSVPYNVQNQPKEPDRKRLKTDAPGVTVNCSLSDWIPLPKQTASIINATPTDPLEIPMSKHPGGISKNQPSRSAPNQDIHESDKNKVNDYCDATSSLKKVKSTFDSSLQGRSLQVLNSKFETPDVLPDKSSLLLCVGKSQAFKSGDVDLQRLFELEELHDKELEEAQEHRWKCEVDERNALKVYRRAQRALLEANSRCTYLYRKREQYSAQLRSCLMEDSSLLYSSKQHHETEEKWNLANNISEVNLDLIPSSHQLDDFELGNGLGYDSNVQSADGDAHNRSSANEDGHNLGSEACSEPDASTSDLVRVNNIADNRLCSPSGDRNLSLDDDYETFPPDHGSLNTNLTGPRSKDDTKKSDKDIDVDSPTIFSTDGSQDPLFLEEYLRSKLISRLGVSSVKRNGIGDNCESSVGRAAEEGFADAKTRMIVQSVSLSNPNISAADYRDVSKEPKGSISKPLLNTQNQQVEEHCLNDSPARSFNHEECSFLSVDVASISVVSLSSIFKSAMKAASPVILTSILSKEYQYSFSDTRTTNNLLLRQNQDKLHLEMTSSAEQLVTCMGFGKIDSYTSKSAINPFWPLCMYELRGRCNNDECPWQHAKDYSDSDDSRSHWASNCQNPTDQTEFSCELTPPRYLVCLDSLKDESHGSHKARDFGSSGKNIFSHSLALSSSLVKHLPSDDPCLHGNDGCVESYGGSGHSLYFQSRNGTGNPLRNGLADNDQSLEMALIILSQEVNKIEGMKKALSMLSRALEADSSSLPIWIIYLLLFYSTKHSDGVLSKKSSVPEDDFFSHAVKHSEVSYELWLLYINSRGRLDDRFSAYERALSRLCNYGSANHEQWMHRSAAILDLFMQMMYCLCVSGNSSNAVRRIKRLVHAEGDFDESHSLLLSDILQCLTISDKCIFWVCCVYLVIYRKLPDSLVQQFEFEKDISLIQWPSAQLTVEEKQDVSRLMEMAIDSVGLNNSKSLESNMLKSAHMLAINHIKLMAAIDGVENCKMFIEKYRNTYSSCLEFILLSARVHVDESSSLEKFEGIVSSWPKNVSGSQCIWNQFAEYALEKGRPGRAKEIMDQWFHSARVPLLFHNGSVDGEIGDDKSISEDPPPGSNLSTLVSNYSNLDLVFGLLNLSLYNLFQNDVLEAHNAVDKALKVADADVFRHCVKEHATFLFNNGSELMKDLSLCELINILKGYTNHAQAIPVLEPLTRKFIQDIRKPRTRQLVRNMLSPISPDSILVNSVLEVWFGLSLLPPKFDQLKDMVDFVEAILEVSPANYQLVISVCKLVCRDFDSSNNKSASVLFWASSLLVNTIYHTFPFPPEHVVVEAADLLSKLTSVQEICESFHQRALLVYPFSIKLWKSFLNLTTAASKRVSVVEAAREKGLELE
ncbi:uncharacterized protein [Spinacia oleracea]|uniref:Uncharacterized protein isoform X3 n=1 Tax=Spinacia oleracea TaxID=3562 RepID=A0A9R0J596_SPIOL|nr:uncharacterized protein LOC110800502 isoform X3 [Spinacia oleracea]XP_056693209.1 uncharacterized protein LOC110800502 isoform X3 [Spinacia oleracea]XP_056693211.1 uncharacterized protein LOC110800502 isoform X3 [Spinacia oleracea]XP_056693214.1 uncharacterized protein LOC110800502 isoform X3 [Spinacia oleracea]